MLKYFCAKNFYYHKSYLYIGDLTLTLESKYLCCWFFSQRYCTIPTNNSTTFQITSLHLKNYPSTIRDDKKQVLQIKSIFLIHWQSIKHLNSQSKKNCQKEKKLSFLVNCQIIVLYIFSMEREGVEENRNIFFPSILSNRLHVWKSVWESFEGTFLRASCGESHSSMPRSL